MNFKDLMVGDLVYVVRGYNKHLTIEKIKGIIEDEDKPYPVTIFTGETVSLNDIKPIPLTENILVKNGFEKTTNDWNRHRPLIIFESMGFPTISIHADMDMKHFWVHGTIDLTYVHQLQRLLNLCNIDKEIIL